jgi:glycosyltransferase involved in cell wall biosynthesis
MADGSEWPRISVITPSFNQACFLEATIRSVLLQGYPNLEYIVLDGGSSDGSVAIIRKYEPWLTLWVSEPDGGQSAAINRGLQVSSGFLVTWINSDDMLCRDALVSHATEYGFHPEVVFIGDCVYIDERGRFVRLHRGRVHDFEDLVRVRTIWRGEPRGHIVQPEVLFPRELAIRVGGVDIHNHRTMDYELWGKLLLAGAAFRYTAVRVGMFRLHGAQKTGQDWLQTQSLVASALRLAGGAPQLPAATRREIADDLEAYLRDYWRNSGPLARAGLPEGIVLSLRDMQTKWRRRASRFRRRAS